MVLPVIGDGMGVEPERIRIVYLDADVIQSEKGVQVLGCFTGQMRNITSRHHGVGQIGQKMEIVVIVWVIHAV